MEILGRDLHSQCVFIEEPAVLEFAVAFMRTGLSVSLVFLQSMSSNQIYHKRCYGGTGESLDLQEYICRRAGRMWSAQSKGEPPSPIDVSGLLVSQDGTEACSSSSVTSSHPVADDAQKTG